jgi:hypothetical protein
MDPWTITIVTQTRGWNNAGHAVGTTDSLPQILPDDRLRRRNSDNSRRPSDLSNCSEDGAQGHYLSEEFLKLCAGEAHLARG